MNLMINVVGSTPAESSASQPPTPAEGAGGDTPAENTPPVAETPAQPAEQPAQPDNQANQPDQLEQPSQPDEPQKKGALSPKMIIGAVVLLILIIGGGIGLYLTQTNQDVRQQARVVAECVTNDDCGGNLKCVSGECRTSTGDPISGTTGTTTTTTKEPECQEDSDCAKGEVCINSKGKCEAAAAFGENGGACRENADCGAGLLCVNSKCTGGAGGGVSTEGRCFTNDDCSSGETCKNNLCVSDSSSTVTSSGTSETQSTGGTQAQTSSSGCSTSISAANCQAGQSPGDACSPNNTSGVCTAKPSQGSDATGVACTCDQPGSGDSGNNLASLNSTPTPTPEDTGDDTETPEAVGGGDETTNNSSSDSSDDSSQENVTLPSELPQTGPEDWLRYIQIGLGFLSMGALLLLFL